MEENNLCDPKYMQKVKVQKKHKICFFEFFL
jgi:hypothetical protein